MILDHLKKWWVLHSALVLSIAYWFVPSVQAWVTAHPKTALAGILGALLTALLKQSPIPPGPIAGAVLFLLLCPIGVNAQLPCASDSLPLTAVDSRGTLRQFACFNVATGNTNLITPVPPVPVPTPPTPIPTPEPTTYVTISGSALGFRDSYLSSVSASSEMEGTVKVTNRISVGYNQITVPDANRVYRFGVANYTLPLNTLLGKKLSSKLAFDASQFDATFQLGVGKLAQTAPSIKLDVIAETFGVYVSHKLMGPLSMRVGAQGLHGGKNPSNAAFYTGLALKF